MQGYDRRAVRPAFWVAALVWMLGGCGGSPTDSGGGGGGGGTTPPPVEKVTLTVQSEPEEGGSVSPSGGTYDKGSSVQLQATAADGWVFDSWTGDVTSEDNPVSLTMSANRSVTANFVQEEVLLVLSLILSSGDQILQHSLGEKEGATSGYDASLEDEIPPPPPEGVLYGWFEVGDRYLKQDLRAPSDEAMEWEFHTQGSENGTTTLFWEIDSIKEGASLTLTSSDESTNVEMTEESSVEWTGTPPETWTIRYQESP